MGLFEQSQIPLKAAIKAMKLDAGAAAIVEHPERLLEVSIPVKMDDGHVKYLPAIVASTARLWDLLRAAFAIIRT
jgi:glutamate dehydrogenase/leucine dehydrogenase